MIAYLEGRVLYIDSDHLVLLVQGVGYQIFLPNRILFTFQADQAACLHIYQVVREDQLTLYGFTTRDEREMFTRVLGVTGIGPKLALSVVSSGEVGTLAMQIVSEDIETLQKIPGIGKKTAQRMAMELKDKLSDLTSTVAWGLFAPALEVKPSSTRSLSSDLLDTLTGLGYGERESRAVIRSLNEEMERGTSLEDLVRTALRQLSSL